MRQECQETKGHNFIPRGQRGPQGQTNAWPDTRRGRSKQSNQAQQWSAWSGRHEAAHGLELKVFDYKMSQSILVEMGDMASHGYVMKFKKKKPPQRQTFSPKPRPSDIFPHQALDKGTGDNAWHCLFLTLGNKYSTAINFSLKNKTLPCTVQSMKGYNTELYNRTRALLDSSGLSGF